MSLLFLKLLLAHMIGDFLFQPDRWVQKKREDKHRSRYLYGHIGVHALALILLLEMNPHYWMGVCGILISHFLIDLAKLHLENERHRGWLFLIDQAAHILVLLIVVYGYHPYDIPFPDLLRPEILLFLICLIGVTSLSAILMRIVMNRWQLPEDKAEDSLPRAGKYIGIIERFLIFGFIILQQWTAIGWLLAAKSILRFSDLSRAKDRKLTEYVLIGTLLSVTIAILFGFLFLYAADQLNLTLPV